MAQWLKQSTAATIPLGPFVNSVDGVSPEVGLSLTQAETRLKKNGGDYAQKNDAATAVHDEEGDYDVTLNATDTNTLGRLRVKVYIAGALPVWQDFMVVPANVWDSMFGADLLQTDLTQWLGGTPNALVSSNVPSDALKPTTAGRTLDVTAAGNAGIDWSNIENQTASVVFTQTTIETVSNLNNPPPWNSAWDAEVESEVIDALQARGVTSARTAFLDNLNIGGPAASQADVQAINFGASQHILIATSSNFEKPAAGSIGFQIEVRTYDDDGNLVAADSTPTLTATGIVSGNLSANLSAASNPATGTYRWTYTVTSGATKEQIRFDASATISAVPYPIATFADVVDAASTDFTTADRTKLEAIHGKLPSKAFIVGTINADGDIQLGEATGGLPDGSIQATTIVADSFTDAKFDDDFWTHFATALQGELSNTYFLHMLFASPVVNASVADNSYAAKLASKSATADIDSFNNQTDSLEALRDSQLAAGAAMTLTSAYDLYHADINFTRDQTNSADEYTSTWFKNGVVLTSGITTPTIQVVRRSDGADLIALTAMTQIGSTGSYKKDETAGRLTVGEAALVTVQAVIDGGTRTWRKPIGRDST